MLYRNCAYSTRPKAECLDLEYRRSDTSSDQEQAMLLQDEDKTSVEESVGGGQRLRRLNTLAHYHVPDAAVCFLVPRLSTASIGAMQQQQQPASKASPALSARGAFSPFMPAGGDHHHHHNHHYQSHLLLSHHQSTAHLRQSSNPVGNSSIQAQNVRQWHLVKASSQYGDGTASGDGMSALLQPGSRDGTASRRRNRQQEESSQLG